VEFDLPRSLALVYDHYYRNQYDYVRLRTDYYNLKHCFEDATKHMLFTIPTSQWPWSLYLTWFWMPTSWKNSGDEKYYPMNKKRVHSFVQGDTEVLLLKAKL